MLVKQRALMHVFAIDQGVHLLEYLLIKMNMVHRFLALLFFSYSANVLMHLKGHVFYFVNLCHTMI